MGERFGSQSLKSPTSDTEFACGATSTNCRVSGRSAPEPRDQGRQIITAPSSAAAASHGQTPRCEGRGAVIASRTRAFRAGLTATGRRNCWIRRSTISSSCSNMLRLPAVSLALVASPLHPHLERRLAGTRQPRDFLVLQTLPVL